MGHGKRHRPEQIILKLREADAMLASEASIGQVCQKLGVSEATLHRWRNQIHSLSRFLRRWNISKPPQSNGSIPLVCSERG